MRRRGDAATVASIDECTVKVRLAGTRPALMRHHQARKCVIEGGETCPYEAAAGWRSTSASEMVLDAGQDDASSHVTDLGRKIDAAKWRAVARQDVVRRQCEGVDELRDRSGRVAT